MNTDSLLDRYDALLLDLDGTVYHGSRAIQGALDGVSAAHEAGVPVRFVTNNAAKSPVQVAEHLRRLGVPAEPGEVATSAQAGARVLADAVSAGILVLVVGTESLEAEVQAGGFATTRTFSDDVGAVIQGHSPETAWPVLAEACLAIRSGAIWVACNVDPTLPTERGQLPGNGSMVAALATATGATPQVAGKPSPRLFAEAARGAGASNALVVGDRLDTDIAGAVAAEIDALLVLSGVSTPADLLAAPDDQRPRYLAADLASVGSSVLELVIGEREAWRIDATDGVLEVRGTGDALSLLRALCVPAWKSGCTAVRPLDDGARSAVSSLGLSAIDYR